MLSFVKALLVAFALAFFFAGVSAEVSGVPQEITVFGMPQDFSFTVQNEENVPRTLSVEFFAPAPFIFLENPGTLGPLETAVVKIRILPQENLEGSTFSALLVTELGVFRSEKTIYISYRKEISCPVEINASVSKTVNAGQTEFVILSEAKNKKNEAEQFSILSFNGLPSTWLVDTENTVLLNGFETRIIRTRIVPDSSFSGQFTVVYSCGDFVETRSVQIDYEQENPLLAGLAGLFLGEGLFGENAFEGLNLLNIFLIIVAAVLLAMFISRLVRVMVAEKSTVEQIRPKEKMQPSQMPPSGIQMQALRRDSKLEELKIMITGEKGAK